MEDKSYNEVRVGIAVFITNETNQVLIGKRIGKHGGGEYGCPGGHMEFGESIREAAKREVMEEIGAEIENIEFLRVLNLNQYPPRHYIDIGVCAKIKSGQTPKLMEPEKCEGWEWHDISNIPSPYFYGLPSLAQSYLDFLDGKRENIFFD
jgi:8-oxo-dGTP diphosphatase